MNITRSLGALRLLGCGPSGLLDNVLHSEYRKEKEFTKKIISLTHYPIIALMRGSHGLNAQRA